MNMLQPQPIPEGKKPALPSPPPPKKRFIRLLQKEDSSKYENTKEHIVDINLITKVTYSNGKIFILLSNNTSIILPLSSFYEFEKIVSELEQEDD
jgi:hypothetical protein